MAKYGLALDNLLAVNLVLADGSAVRASADDHPDLFWAVRGGGGNFGVASSFEFRLHPVGPMVTGGIVAFPFAEARQVLRAWRDMANTVPDELVTVALLGTAPDGSGKPIVIVGACHCGPAADGQAVAAQIKSFGTVVMDAMGPISYGALNVMLDAGNPPGVLNYWKSAFIHELTDTAIDALLSAYAGCPVPSSQILLENVHGAASRVPVDATAYALRDSGFNTVMLGIWNDPAHGEGVTKWCRESFAAMQRFVGPRRYLNYLGPDDDAEGAAGAAYGPNLARLRKIKKRYDPENVFHLNVNIPPEA
jgi:FAD/FMN-containing dehydrogenase